MRSSTEKDREHRARTFDCVAARLIMGGDAFMLSTCTRSVDSGFHGGRCGARLCAFLRRALLQRQWATNH